ncbi:MAG: hypothetical protein M3N57_09115, partial [Actinomycetota bacterium]|nr:hypothetical protein [Actinomycetota bacterium]
MAEQARGGARPRWVGRALAGLLAMLLAVPGAPLLAPSAAAAPGDVCYTASNGTDELIAVQRDTAVAAVVGKFGVADVEALAFDPAGTTLYAA